MIKRDDGRDERGFFAPGNRIWTTRRTCGPKPIFSNPEDLWAACLGYFDWVDENPMIDSKVVPGKGVMSVPRDRPPTLAGLCVHLGISRNTWADWRQNRSDLMGVVTRVDEMIYDDHVTGGMTERYNPNLTARITGLTDKSEVDNKSSDGSMTPKASMDMSRLSSEALKEIVGLADETDPS